MTRLGFVRTVSAAVALLTARAALAAGEPTFQITSSGWWSLLGTAIFVSGLVWMMRKMG